MASGSRPTLCGISPDSTALSPWVAWQQDGKAERLGAACPQEVQAHVLANIHGKGAFPKPDTHSAQAPSHSPNPTHIGILGGQTATPPDRLAPLQIYTVGIYCGRFSVNYRHEMDAVEEGLGSKKLRYQVSFQGSRLTMTFTLNLSHPHRDPCPHRHSG